VKDRRHTSGSGGTATRPARPLEVLARLLIASGGTVTGGAAIVDGSAYWGSGYCGTLCLGSSTPLLNNNKVYAFSLR
jgi:hypothetical protein